MRSLYRFICCCLCLYLYQNQNQDYNYNQIQNQNLNQDQYLSLVICYKNNLYSSLDKQIFYLQIDQFENTVYKYSLYLFQEKGHNCMMQMVVIEQAYYNRNLGNFYSLLATISFFQIHTMVWIYCQFHRYWLKIFDYLYKTSY